MNHEKQQKGCMSKVKVLKKPKMAEAAAQVPQRKWVLVSATNAAQAAGHPEPHGKENLLLERFFIPLF